jgi:rubredoxin
VVNREVGASFSIYEKNWHCPGCKFENFANRFKCQRCRTRKPEGTDNVVPDPVLQQVLHNHTHRIPCYPLSVHTFMDMYCVSQDDVFVLS